MEERVYCLASSRLPEPSPEVLPLTPELFRLIATQGEFRLRAEVEEDEAYRQIIPYAVVEQSGQVLLVERLRAGSEARLHAKLSIGLGGHINPEDLGGARDPVEAALARELREELEIGAFFAEAVGLIHRDESSVERVHTCVLYHVRTPGRTGVRETKKLRGRLATPEEIIRQRDRLELWSQAALRFLLKTSNARG